jgi:hypothetical protein
LEGVDFSTGAGESAAAATKIVDMIKTTRPK